jgi:hypothetical protein
MTEKPSSVAIHFYEDDFLLPHRLDMGLFCNPVRVAILKQLKHPFIGVFLFQSGGVLLIPISFIMYLVWQ